MEFSFAPSLGTYYYALRHLTVIRIALCVTLVLLQSAHQSAAFRTSLYRLCCTSNTSAPCTPVLTTAECRKLGHRGLAYPSKDIDISVAIMLKRATRTLFCTRYSIGYVLKNRLMNQVLLATNPLSGPVRCNYANDHFGSLETSVTVSKVKV